MNKAIGNIETGRNKSTPSTARQRREARIRFWRVFAVSSFFVVVLSANLYIGAVVMMGNFGSPLVVSKVPIRQTAQIKRPLLDGTFCRNTVYDNVTSHMIEDKVERCDKTANQPRGKNRTQFSWGGR